MVDEAYNKREHKLAYLIAKLCAENKSEVLLRHVENSLILLDGMNKDPFSYSCSIIDNSFYSPDFLDDIDYLYRFGYLTTDSRRNKDEWFDHFITLVDKERVINELSGISPEIDEFIDSEYLSKCLESEDFGELMELAQAA